MMRHRVLVSAVLAFSAAIALAPAIAVAQAQQKSAPAPAPQKSAPQQAAPQQAPAVAPPKPYKPLAVALPAAINDPSFEAFRKDLAGVAQKKDRAALARLI